MVVGILLALVGLSLVGDVFGDRWIGLPERRNETHLSMGVLFLGIGLLLVAANATAATPARPRATIHVPEVNALTRHLVEQAAAEEWGVDASAARLAAQMHQESAWNPKARSGVGAQGLAQFMPATGKWLAQLFPELGAYDPWDPAWSARAAAVYDHYLLQRNPGADPCSHWAFALSAYNGGERALRREQARADKTGRDGRIWFWNTAPQRARSPGAWRENRGYVRRILTQLEPAYIAAGWSGNAVCS